MSPKPVDPTDPIRHQASQYPAVDQGKSCTQSSFKAGNKAFLYIGMQGGRYKAMFKLGDSLPEAIRLAQQQPDNYQVGNTAWVTARFTAEHPLPERLWKRWLEESYRLSCPGAAISPSPGKATPRKKK